MKTNVILSKAVLALIAFSGLCVSHVSAQKSKEATTTAAAALKATMTQAQPSRVPASGEGACAYVINPGADPIVPGTADTGNHCDDCDTSVSLPFPVQVCNQTFNSVNVNSNGRLDFVCVNEPVGYLTHCLPASPNQCPFDYTIFPLWHDMRTDVGLPGCSTWGNGCGIFTSVSGTAPNRILNIEWHAVRFSNTSNAVNFEVRLYENSPSNRFDVIYGVSAGVTGLDTAGIQGAGGSFVQDFCNVPPPQNASRTYGAGGACSNDIAASTFVRPTNGGGVGNGTTIMPQASFTNVGTIVQNNVMVQFTINGPGGYTYSNIQSIPTINPTQQITVTFATTPMFTLTGGYQMDAAVITPDCNPANDAIHGTFSVGNSLGGTVTVGAGATYSSLTNPGGVFDAINNFGLNSSLNVDIISDLTGETGTVALNQWVVGPDCGCNVTIRPRGMLNSPNGGVPRTISGTSVGGGLIKLNGADGVTIDGSIGGGGTDRSLTITNSNANATVIWIASADASNGANNIIVENCNISGSPGVIAVAGILSGSGTTLGNNAEAPNNSITIQNNNIFRVQNSCYLRGTAAGSDMGWVVTGNTLGSTNPADKNIFRGIGVFNCMGFVISSNTVGGVVSTASSTSKMTGIQTGLVINGGTIAKNKVSDIKQINTGTYGATGIDLTGGNNILVKNNFVFDVNHDNSGGIAFSTLFGVFGIQIEAGTGIQVYDNSVNLFGSIGSNNNSSLLDAAFGINATGSTGCDVRDNIFANNITGGTTSIAHVAVYLPSGGTPSMNLTENKNSYYNGTDPARAGVGQAGTTAGTNFFLTLSQLAAYSMTLSPPGTNDNASIASTGPVPYLTAMDLHLMCTAPEINLGVPLAPVTDDIDGDPRNPVTPTIGADEPINCGAPTVTSAVSRKIHGGAGTFDIPLSTTCPSGVECRSGGASGNYTLVVTFNAPVTVTGSPQAAVTCGTGCVGSAGVCDGNVSVNGAVVTVPLTTIANAQNITVQINGVNGTTNVPIPMGILIGDTNGNRSVNAGDVAQTKGRVGQVVNASNFRSDVNANGSISAGDLANVKANSGLAISSCCP